MEQEIIELRHKLWMMAYVVSRGQEINQDRFDSMRDKLFKLQEQCSVDRLHEWETDWELWDGNISTIVLQSPELRNFLANGGKIPHRQRKTADKHVEVAKPIKSTPKQEKPVKNANTKPKKKGRLF